VLFFVFLVPFTTFSQQSTLITHYMFTDVLYNPAFAGSADGINVTGLIREQWLGYNDPDGNRTSPETFLITLDAPVKILHGAAEGSVMQDNIGYFKNIEVRLGYAYKANLGAGELSAGLQVDLFNSKVDFSSLKTIDVDQLLQDQGKATDFVADLGLGVMYKVPDKFYIGLSSDKLMQTKEKKIYYTLKREYFLTGGYTWVIPGHPEYEIEPSLYFRTDASAFQFDISALLMYSKKVWGGLAYRMTDAVSVLGGMNIKGIRIGLAYDISTSAMTKYNSGGLEVMLNYCFKIKMDKFRKSYKNARFL
jgi:type IX secretion system PorP/SprF family membrane protein